MLAALAVAALAAPAPSDLREAAINPKEREPIYAPALAPCDAGFTPTCEQAKGFGLCDAASSACNTTCVDEVKMTCPVTCSLSAEATFGHLEADATPSDYSKHLPPTATAAICSTCAGHPDLPCCHDHPHESDDGRRLQAESCTAAISDVGGTCECTRSTQYGDVNGYCDAQPPAPSWCTHIVDPDHCNAAGFDGNGYGYTECEWVVPQATPTPGNEKCAALPFGRIYDFCQSDAECVKNFFTNANNTFFGGMNCGELLLRGDRMLLRRIATDLETLGITSDPRCFLTDGSGTTFKFSLYEVILDPGWHRIRSLPFTDPADYSFLESCGPNECTCVNNKLDCNCHAFGHWSATVLDLKDCTEPPVIPENRKAYPCEEPCDHILDCIPGFQRPPAMCVTSEAGNEWQIWGNIERNGFRFSIWLDGERQLQGGWIRDVRSNIAGRTTWWTDGPTRPCHGVPRDS